MATEDIEILKLAVPCDLLLKARGFTRYRRSDATPDDEARSWRHENGQRITSARNGTAWSALDGSAHGDVYALVGHLDLAVSNFADQKAIVEKFATPERLQRAREEIQTRPNYAKLWVRQPKPTEGSPAWTYLTETYKIAPDVLRAAIEQDTLREGPNATTWFGHFDHTGRLTGWQGLGPEFKGVGRGSEMAVWSVDLAGGHPTQLVIATSPISAMSHATKPITKGDTLYAGTSGRLTGDTLPALLSLMGKLNPETDTVMIEHRSQRIEDEKMLTQIGDMAVKAGFDPRRVLMTRPFGQIALELNMDTPLRMERSQLFKEPHEIPLDDDGRPIPAPAAAPAAKGLPGGKRVAAPEAHGADPSPQPASPPAAQPTSPEPTGNTMSNPPEDKGVQLIQRGSYQNVPDKPDTQVSLDLGQSTLGFHYRLWQAEGQRDPEQHGWSLPFHTRDEATMAGDMRARTHYKAEIPNLQTGVKIDPAKPEPATGPANTNQPTAPEVMEANRDNPLHTALLAMRNAVKRQSGPKAEAFLKKIDQMLKKAGTVSFDDDAFRAEIGYLYYDTMRALGIEFAMDSIARNTIAYAGLNVPGLAPSSPMHELMMKTTSLKSQEMVNEIRRSAEAMGKRPAPQTDPESRKIAAGLASKVRASEEAEEQKRARASSDQSQIAGAKQTGAKTEAQTSGTTINAQKVEIKTRPHIGPIPTGAKPQPDHPAAPRSDFGLDKLFDRASKFFTHPLPEEPEDMKKPAPYADPQGYEKAEARIQDVGQPVILSSARKSAMEAIEAMTNANELMGALRQKIDSAADTDPGGIKSVMEGMRQEGRYAELRREFNALYEGSEAFRKQFDFAKKRLASYWIDRLDVEETFTPERRKSFEDAMAETERDLHRKASYMPSTEEEGGNMLGEMARRFGAAVKAIVARVSARFKQEQSPAPTPDQRPRPGPSMGMG